MRGRTALVDPGGAKLVPYHVADEASRWGSLTDGKPFGVIVMQGDGHLVVDENATVLDEAAPTATPAAVSWSRTTGTS